MPVENLYMLGTKVTDISALTGSKLRQLWLNETPISDLAPLAGAPIVSLTLHRTQVSDLSFVRNLPVIQRLHIAETPVTDLTPLKGVDRAVAIAAALDRPLVVIGSGEVSEALQTQAADAPVVFTGRLPREAVLAQLERAAAILLLPRVDEDGTGAEGLGLCLIEAALRQTPAIGCMTGGVPEAVGPGLVLADPDHPDMDAITDFLADPTAGPRARQHAMSRHGSAAALAVLDAVL